MLRTPIFASALALCGAYAAYRLVKQRRRRMLRASTKPVALIFGPATKFASDIGKRLKTEWELVVASVSVRKASTLYLPL